MTGIAGSRWPPPAPNRAKDCLTPLHTIKKCRRNFRLRGTAQVLNRDRPIEIDHIFQSIETECLPKRLWHEACDMAFRAPPNRRSRGLAAVDPPKEQPMDFGRISRRQLLQGGAALTLGTAFGARSARAADTTIGFIYVGSRDDYGYNQAHAQGAAALKKMPGLKIVEEEKVAETDAVEKTMESMINLDGATLLFPTSFGYYNPHVIKTASKFPNIRFEHAVGFWTDKDPKNAGTHFAYTHKPQYISDISTDP